MIVAVVIVIMPVPVVVAVHVPVIHFLGCGGAHADDLDLKGQLFAGQWMVEIQAHGIFRDVLDAGGHCFAVLGAHLQIHSGFQRNIRRELLARYFYKGFFVQLAVTFAGRNNHVFAFASGHTVKRIFKARDDVPFALDKFKRFAFFCTMGGSGASRVFAAMRQLTGREPLATLALTDSEVDATARAKFDAFVQEVRWGSPRRGQVRARAAHAVA